MPPSLTAVVAAFAVPAATVPTDFRQVAPDVGARAWWQTNQPRKDRAVVLIHGLKLHPLKPARVTRAEFHDWQEPRADLVKALARNSDVFALAYAQTVPLDVIVHTPGLREAVGRIRAAGYREIVLVGHSAGGVIARHFAESYPDAGVTRVVQVASPNAGSELAAVIHTGYPRVQAPFIQSLAPAARMEAGRRARPPGVPKVESVCVVCKVRGIDGDGLLSIASQWSDDLQQQGVPAVLLPVSHWEAMRTGSGIRLISELARERLTRWSPADVDRARKVLFRDADERK